MLAALARLPGTLLRDVPVDPDAETARSWVEAELADPIYHERQSLLDMALRWLLERWEDAQGAISGVDPVAAALVLGSIVLVGTLVVLAVAGPVRRGRRLERGSVELFVDDTRTAAELRAAADAHALAGRWSDAVADRFRALLRALEERAVVDERPGKTAHEAALEAGAALPAHAADLLRGSRLFDDVCYGDADASADDDAWLRALDAAVAAARPTHGAALPDDDALPAVPR